MIVDNVDDSSVFLPPLDRTQAIGSDKPGQAAESLSGFLPQSPDGSILITSRSRDVAYRLTGSHTYIREVKPMDESDALALLRKKFSFDADEHNAIELLQVLDYMPLAITQAESCSSSSSSSGGRSSSAGCGGHCSTAGAAGSFGDNNEGDRHSRGRIGGAGSASDTGRRH